MIDLNTKRNYKPGVPTEGNDSLAFHKLRTLLNYIQDNVYNLDLKNYDLLNMRTWAGYGVDVFDINGIYNDNKKLENGTKLPIPLFALSSFTEIPSKKNKQNSPFGEYLVVARSYFRNIAIWKLKVHPIKNKYVGPLYKTEYEILGAFVNSSNLEFEIKNIDEPNNSDSLLTKNHPACHWGKDLFDNWGWEAKLTGEEHNQMIGRFDTLNTRLREAYKISRLRDFILENFDSESKRDSSNSRLKLTKNPRDSKYRESNNSQAHTVYSGKKKK